MQPRNLSHPGAQGVMVCGRQQHSRVRVVEGRVQPAGCSTTARAQEDGPVIWEALLSCTGANPEQVGPSEGNRSSGAKQSRESEGRIGALTSGNGRHPDPGEQRRPVLM